MTESKEIKIGDKIFLILKERSFIAQCDLEIHIPEGKADAPRYYTIIADCKIEDIIRDKKGNMVAKEYRDITIEDLSELSIEQGDELYLKLLKFRFPEAFKKLLSKKKKGKGKTS